MIRGVHVYDVGLRGLAARRPPGAARAADHAGRRHGIASAHAMTTTQIYMTPRKEEVIRRVLAHHAEQTRQAAERARPAPAPGYRPETLQVLFGSRTS